MAIKQPVIGDLVTTESDSGHYIIRDDGMRYESAVDPVGSGRTYTESDELIPVPEVP
jgi:hypothetical protein